MRGRITHNVICTVSLAGVALMMAVSAALNRIPFPQLAFLDIAPAIAVLLSFAAAFSLFPKASGYAFVFICDAIAIYESILGLMQAAGKAMIRHSLFTVTGTFDNPGPYGGFLAITGVVALSFVLRHRKEKISLDRQLFSVLQILSFLALMLVICVLPSTMSRTGWCAFIAGGVAAAAFAYGSEGCKKLAETVRSHPWLFALLCCAIIAGGVGAWSIKAPSARGRVHIWKIDCITIAEHPLIGAGPSLHMGAYGEAQEHYFASKQRSISSVVAAGCPEYPFNEYLGLGMKAGAAALLLALAFTVSAVPGLGRRCPEAAAAIVSFAVFASGSYPLSVPLLKYMAAALAGAAISGKGFFPRRFLPVSAVVAVVFMICLAPALNLRRETEKEWKQCRVYSGIGLYEKQTKELLPMYSLLGNRFRYLYDLGYGLHKQGLISESQQYLEEGSVLSSDPMFFNIMGKNLESEGDFNGAEKMYMKALARVPGRLYPRSLLIDLYLCQGRDSDASRIAEEALTIPVNPRHIAMQELKTRIEHVADSLVNTRKNAIFTQ